MMSILDPGAVAVKFPVLKTISQWELPRFRIQTNSTQDWRRLSSKKELENQHLLGVAKPVCPLRLRSSDWDVEPCLNTHITVRVTYVCWQTSSRFNTGMLFKNCRSKTVSTWCSFLFFSNLFGLFALDFFFFYLVWEKAIFRLKTPIFH